MITIKLNFFKLSTSENTTVIITDYVPEKLYSKISEKVMSSTHLEAEQVGFLLPPEKKDSQARLEMSGGEFCGNGVLALGALCDHLGIINDSNFSVEISGVNSSLKTEIIETNCLQEKYVVKAAMPVCYSRKSYICNYSEQIQGDIIFLQGISHFLIRGENNFDEKIIKDIMNEISENISGEAVGIIPYFSKNNEYFIKPYIYVKENNSYIFERGCGSGTLALGLYLAEENTQNIYRQVNQPGGVIEVMVKLNNKNEVSRAFLKSEVNLTCQGTVVI